jgi:hypothetical protein
MPPFSSGRSHRHLPPLVVALPRRQLHAAVWQRSQRGSRINCWERNCWEPQSACATALIDAAAAAAAVVSALFCPLFCVCRVFVCLGSMMHVLILQDPTCRWGGQFKCKQTGDAV